MSTTGAKLRTKATNPSVLLAHGNPNLVYIPWLASGRNAAKTFSPKQIAAEALAAYLAYASVTYIIMACITTIVPKPIRKSPADGSHQERVGLDVHPYQNKPPVRPMNEPGTARYSLFSASRGFGIIVDADIARAKWRS